MRIQYQVAQFLAKAGQVSRAGRSNSPPVAPAHFRNASIPDKPTAHACLANARARCKTSTPIKRPN
jgi:hypothetical protein